MAKEKISSDQLISVIISGIEDVKGNEINILDLRDIENSVCDYFIICEGTSNNAEWVLMDYVNVVVHVFQRHIRDYYDIESLWGDAKTTVIETNY